MAERAMCLGLDDVDHCCPRTRANRSKRRSWPIARCPRRCCVFPLRTEINDHGDSSCYAARLRWVTCTVRIIFDEFMPCQCLRIHLPSTCDRHPMKDFMCLLVLFRMANGDGSCWWFGLKEAKRVFLRVLFHSHSSSTISTYSRFVLVLLSDSDIQYNSPTHTQDGMTTSINFCCLLHYCNRRRMVGRLQ